MLEDAHLTPAPTSPWLLLPPQAQCSIITLQAQTLQTQPSWRQNAPLRGKSKCYNVFTSNARPYLTLRPDNFTTLDLTLAASVDPSGIVRYHEQWSPWHIAEQSKVAPRHIWTSLQRNHFFKWLFCKNVFLFIKHQNPNSKNQINSKFQIQIAFSCFVFEPLVIGIYFGFVICDLIF